MINKKIEELEAKLANSFVNSPTMEESEKLAAEFLHAQFQISRVLTSKDLDARNRKHGLKQIRSTLYKEFVSGQDKKPTEATLAAMIDTHELVAPGQEALDLAEVERDELSRAYDLCLNGHIFYRGIAKAGFNG